MTFDIIIMTDKYVKYKVFLWIVTVLIALNLLTLALIWFGKPEQRHDKFPPPPEHVAGFFKNELGWSKEQSDKFEQIREKYFNESKVLIDSVIFLRKELFKLISEGPSENEKASGISKNIGELQSKIDLQRYGHFRDIQNICDTPEQKKKFQEILMEVFLPHPVPEGMRPGPPPPFPRR